MTANALRPRRFDLIASNPPFVLTPPAVREAGLPLMEYRDAGRPILPGLVAGLGEHLGVGVRGYLEEHNKRLAEVSDARDTWLRATAGGVLVGNAITEPGVGADADA